MTNYLIVVGGCLALGSFVGFCVWAYSAAAMRALPLVTGLRVTCWSAVILLVYIVIVTKV